MKAEEGTWKAERVVDKSTETKERCDVTIRVFPLNDVMQQNFRQKQKIKRWKEDISVVKPNFCDVRMICAK